MSENLAKRLKVQRANLVSIGMKVSFPLYPHSRPGLCTLVVLCKYARRDTDRLL